MKTSILLGIITVIIFGSLAVSGLFVHAGLEDIETIQVTGTAGSFSSATCPISHPFLIGGSYAQNVQLFSSFDFIPYGITPNFDVSTNTYSVTTSQSDQAVSISVTAYALCATINFPMMNMIGGELLDIDTMTLFVYAIGVNPVITGLVAITIAGVAAQSVLFVQRRRKSENS